MRSVRLAPAAHPAAAIIRLTLALVFTAAATPAATSYRGIYASGSGRLEAELTIGGEDADDDHVLFSASSVRPDAQGNIYVLDYKMFRVRKFSPDGEHLVTFGREGEGPGEMRRAYFMELDRDGNVVIFDTDGRRFTWFDPSGEYIRSVGFQDWIRGFDARPDGRFYVLTQSVDFAKPDVPYMMRVERCGADMSRLSVFDSLETHPQVTIRKKDGMFSFSAPFAENLVSTMLPDGSVAVAGTRTYEIRVYTPDGQLARTIRRDVPAPELAQQDKDEYFEGFGEDGLPPEAVAEVKFPKTRTFFTSLVADEEGCLLVRLPQRNDETAAFDVFDPEGQFIGRVTIPELSTRAIFQGGVIYASWYPEDELPGAARYRLVGGDAPASNP